MRYKYASDGIEFDYEIKQKRGQKHAYIRIKDGIAVVTSGMNVSVSYLHDLLAKNAQNIYVNLQTIQERPRYDLSSSDAKMYLLGEEYDMIFVYNMDNRYCYIDKEDDRFVLTLNQKPTHELIRRLRDIYYKSQCSSIITEIVYEQSKIMDSYPNKISYRHTKSRWGSCSGQNSISLNTRLMMLPLVLIKYVVIHELAHITHKNHSVIFWNFVAIYDKNYQMHRKSLRAYEWMIE